MVSSYVPPLPCREHMLRDLPAVLQGVEQLAFIVDECGIMSEAVLQRLPAGGGGAPCASLQTRRWLWWLMPSI